MLGNSGGGSSYAQPWPESGWGCSAPGAVPGAMEQGIGSDGTTASGVACTAAAAAAGFSCAGAVPVAPLLLVTPAPNRREQGENEQVCLHQKYQKLARSRTGCGTISGKGPLLPMRGRKHFSQSLCYQASLKPQRANHTLYAHAPASLPYPKGITAHSRRGSTPGLAVILVVLWGQDGRAKLLLKKPVQPELVEEICCTSSCTWTDRPRDSSHIFWDAQSSNLPPGLGKQRYNPCLGKLLDCISTTHQKEKVRKRFSPGLPFSVHPED